MALGGGTFTTMNKILPGTYINFVSAPRASAALSDRGIAAMPAEFDWGPEGAVFLAREDGADVGFAQCGLRRDYVEGTHTSPVGYLEGVFVQEEYRGRGVATALLRACEAWAGEKGCAEFASDCGLDNAASAVFHLRAGFAEAGRIICFTKRL